MKELIHYIATSLVDNPEQVQVIETEQDDTIIIELTVAKEDLGKVIGKQGRTAKAMRALLAAAAGKINKRSRLEIME
ncbi:MAG: KH domain-containing protein [Deltaproteobacteria bacterium]|jgi:predicted RNA-binding protein YlqC (UPF0109 family)|nr:KH domain-containing protein [Deltaproteobacteria bacterium]